MSSYDIPKDHIFEPDLSYPDAMFYYDHKHKEYTAYSESVPEAVVQGTSKAAAYIDLMQVKRLFVPVHN